MRVLFCAVVQDLMPVLGKILQFTPEELQKMNAARRSKPQSSAAYFTSYFK